ncbi:MAG: hypothetical protein ACLTZI_02450 [[Eubacterium] siraeum]
MTGIHGTMMTILITDAVKMNVMTKSRATFANLSPIANLMVLNKAADEYRRFFEKMKEICCAKDRKQYFTTLAFYHGLLERLTESCLIDADRTATARIYGRH